MGEQGMGKRVCMCARINAMQETAFQKGFMREYLYIYTHHT